eukprot:COSAG03_NODE_29209_length_188_cov_163.651685_1_plen_52_part_01
MGGEAGGKINCQVSESIPLLPYASCETDPTQLRAAKRASLLYCRVTMGSAFL